MTIATPDVPTRILRGASISADGLYRYSLWRGPQDGLLLPFIMLNPSTADASVDDPTIRRCRYFAQREGFEGIYVANLYAYRATQPAVLKAVADPYGPENAAILDGVARLYPKIVCAWGANADPNYAGLITRLLKSAGAELVCLGTTKAGAPKHPLYIPSDQPLVAYP